MMLDTQKLQERKHALARELTLEIDRKLSEFQREFGVQADVSVYAIDISTIGQPPKNTFTVEIDVSI